MKKILQKNEKILRQIANEVRVSDIKTNKIKKVLREMSEALESQNDGVAIAAPQIGYGLRIFLISGKIFEEYFIRERKDKMEKHHEGVLDVPDSKEIVEARVGEKIGSLIFINPKISKLSKEKHWVPEGCLSVRPLYGKTFRSKKATVSAYDENGKKFVRGASGLLAQIFQHETDHLNGILFIDHAKDIKEDMPQK